LVNPEQLLQENDSAGSSRNVLMLLKTSQSRAATRRNTLRAAAQGIIADTTTAVMVIGGRGVDVQLWGPLAGFSCTRKSTLMTTYPQIAMVGAKSPTHAREEGH
jgi:hypothetical protein